jgi:hypothetical protein
MKKLAFSVVSALLLLLFFGTFTVGRAEENGEQQDPGSAKL